MKRSVSLPLMGAVLLVSALQADILAAQQATPTDSTERANAQRLETVTVTAVRGRETAATTATVLQQGEIQRGYVGEDMTRVLENAPSVTAYSENGAFNNYSYIRLRGIDQSRINFTLDGIPLNEPEDQGLYFSNFPDFANSIRSAEVQRGVGTSGNGTASYVGAVSFESIALAGSRRQGEVQLTGGSFGTRRASLEYLTGHGDNGLAGYARVSGLRTDGYRHNSGNESVSAFASGGWFGSRDAVKVVALGGRSRNEMAYYAASEAELAHDRQFNPLAESDDFSQGFASIGWTRATTAASTFNATLYGSASDGWYDVAGDDAVYRLDLTSRWVGGLSTWSWRADRAALDAGAHASRYARDHQAAIRGERLEPLYFNTGTKTDVSAFAKGRLSFGAIDLYADLQARRAGFQYDPDANSGLRRLTVDWAFLNPRVGITARPAARTEVYLSWGSTGREPARSDLFAGGDDLTAADYQALGGTLERVRPERVHDTEAGVAWRGDRLALNANAFLMRFRDEIAPIGPLSPTTGSPLRKNVPRSVRRGVELDARWEPTSRLTVGADAAAMWARIDRYEDDATGVVYRDVEPLLTPRLVAGQHARFAVAPNLGLSFDGRYTSRMMLTNTGESHLSVPGSWRFGAGAEWAVRGTTLHLQARNLLNDDAYASGYAYDGVPYYYVHAPRSVFLTVSRTF